MTSTLQKQLAAIAASTTHQLDLKAQKSAHAKSLLFETKVAASQSFENVYLICHDGYRELCTLDARFLAFSTNLFSEQSKVEDRAQMTGKQNEELNKVLEAFITLVGPRLMLKPAEKALEWLVRRFRVHEYNTECLVMTYLPYHNTPQFLALLSILPVHPPSALRFLSPYIPSATNPPRRVITYTAINTPAFFDALQVYVTKVLQAGHQNAHLLSFWSSITVEAVFGILNNAATGRREIQDQRTEELVLRILPVLNSCMRVQHGTDAVAACYTIVIVLVTQAKLGDKVLDGLVEAVWLAHDQESLIECLACLAVIAGERSKAEFPLKISKRLLKLPQVTEKLKFVSKQCQVERLVLACALGALHNINQSDENQTTFRQLLDSQLLSKSRMEVVLFALLRLVRDSVTGSEEHAQLSNTAERLAESTQLRDLLQTAAKNDQIDLESLGLTFQHSLQTEQAPSEDEDDDTAMDAEGLGNESSAALSVPNISVSSFLDPEANNNFAEINDAFAHAVASKCTKPFLDSTSLARKEASTKSTYISFLIQIWCGARSVPVRIAALKAATKAITSYGNAFSLQNTIPYLLYALTDMSPLLRGTAASCIAALCRNSKTDEKSQVWGNTDLYGKASKKISTLKEGDLEKLLSSILEPILEECVMDPNFVITAVQSILEGTEDAKAHQKHSLKTQSRTSILSFFLSHTVLTPLLRVRLCLLPISSFRGKASDGARGSTLLPAVRQWCSLPTTELISLCANEGLSIENVERGQLGALLARDANSIALLQELTSGFAKDRVVLTNAAFDRINLLWPSMKGESKLSLGQHFLDLSLKDSDDAYDAVCRERALETLRNVKLSSTILETFLENASPATQMPEGPPSKKRRRTSRSELARADSTSSQGVQILLRRLTLILELIESTSPEKHPALCKSLFGSFGHLQALQQQSGSELVYLQAIALSSLTAMVDTIKAQSNAAEYQQFVRADLIVDCIRLSTSPQVQNNALLLIANLATWVPELILHNLMPIFTFLGSTLLRQQDEYSAHIVDKTISRVVPQLAASLRRKHQNFLTGVSDLLLSFTAAFEHIPSHRRLKLFSELARTLGPEDSLSAIIALLADRYENGKVQRRFSMDLLLVFDPIDTLNACKGYLDLVIDAAGSRTNVANTFFSLKEKSPTQIEATLKNLLSCLADLATEGRLRNHFTRAFHHKEGPTKPRKIFAKIIESIILLSKKVASSSKLYDCCSRLLSRFLDLLPTVDLVKSSELLLSNPDVQVQVAAIKAIELRAGATLQNDRRSVPALLSFIPHLDKVLQQAGEMDTKIISVSCIDRIIEKFGKKEISIVLSVAHTVSGPQALSSSDDRVRILSLLCLTSVVDVIEDEAIPLLPAITSKALDYLAHAIEEKKTGLHNAVYTLLSNIVERLGYMFSRDHLKLALALSHRSSVADLEDSCDKSRSAFYQSVSGNIEAQEVFSALKSTWHSAVSAGFRAVIEHLGLLHSTIETQTKSKLVKASSSLYEHFLEIFQLRATIAADKIEGFEDDEIHQVEDTIVESVISMVFKLNDATFRPFFIQLVDQEGPRHSVTFFKFLASFFDKFKSIVTSYSSYTLDHAAKTLTLLAQDDAQSELRDAVLDSLQKSFEHDQDGFWHAPTHFSTILPPLLSLLSLPSSSYTSLAPAPPAPIITTITSLAHCTSTSSSPHHHDITTSLLKLMRDSSASTRLATVLTEQALTARLGEEWLALLPEMLPFIAELRDDEDERVERETVRWINSIEEVLGESLEGMLQ